MLSFRSLQLLSPPWIFPWNNLAQLHTHYRRYNPASKVCQSTTFFSVHFPSPWIDIFHSVMQCGIFSEGISESQQTNTPCSAPAPWAPQDNFQCISYSSAFSLPLWNLVYHSTSCQRVTNTSIHDTKCQVITFVIRIRKVNFSCP